MAVCLETDKEQTRGFGFGGCLLGLHKESSPRRVACRHMRRIQGL
jgi:hypothetical protein